MTDALGNETVYELAWVRAMQRVTRVTGPCESCGGAGGSAPREWIFDAEGNVVLVSAEDFRAISGGPADMVTDIAVGVRNPRELVTIAEKIAMPLEPDADYETVAGFVLDALHRLPEVGEHFDHGPWRFEVVDLDGRRIDKVLLAPRLKGERGDVPDELE